MPSLLPLTTSLLLTLPLFTTPALAQDSCATACDDVHFFLARGNNEPYPGRQAQLVSATCAGLRSCGYEDLLFSDLYTDLYCQIVYDATVAGHVQMTAYAQRCPDSKLILAGYSSGGQAAGDILAGGGGELFDGCVQPETPALDRETSPGNQIAAAIIFGDVRHTANETYNFGTGSPHDGWFPRPASQLANLAAYAPILRNWCVDTDPICAAHLPDSDEESHLDYFDRYSEAAAEWIWEVAGLTREGDFATTVARSVSGTVQDYATVGTGSTGGTAVVDRTWTDMVSVAACTGSESGSVSASATVGSGSASETGTVVGSETSRETQRSTTTRGPVTSAATQTSEVGSVTSSGSAAVAEATGNAAGVVVAAGEGWIWMVAGAVLLGV